MLKQCSVQGAQEISSTLQIIFEHCDIFHVNIHSPKHFFIVISAVFLGVIDLDRTAMFIHTIVLIWYSL